MQAPAKDFFEHSKLPYNFDMVSKLPFVVAYEKQTAWVTGAIK